jgi:cobalt-zinc-cadmium efflux system membrane fusion protein
VGNFDRLWLVGNVREEDAPQMKVGQAVEVTVAALPGRHFAGRLAWVAPSIDPVTHRLAVRADLSNTGGVLKPAMFATMAIHASDNRVSPAVPEIAVIHDGDSDHVWVSVGGDGLQLRAIKPGRSQNGFTEVLSGLSRGDRVALGGSLFLDSSARAD